MGDQGETGMSLASSNQEIKGSTIGFKFHYNKTSV